MPKRSGGASTSTSSTSFTPLSDLVPASIPFTDQARGVLEALRAGRDPGIDALLRALNCGGACEAAGAPYSAKCGCRAAFAAAAAGGGGAGGGAAPRCVRGLAPPPGSHRKVGLWAKPPKAEEEAEEKEAKEGEKEEEVDEEEEVRRTRVRGQFFFFLSDSKKKTHLQKTKHASHTENRPRRPLQPRGHLLCRRGPAMPLRRPGVQARALQRHERGRGRRR